MKKLLVAAVSACVLAGTFAGAASAAPASTNTEPVGLTTLPAVSDGKGVVPGEPAVRPLACQNGLIQYGWDGTPNTAYDFISLYSTKPDPNDYTKNRLATSGVVDAGTVKHTFSSNTKSGQTLWTAYWSYDQNTGKAVIVDQEGPERKFCT